MRLATKGNRLSQKAMLLFFLVGIVVSFIIEFDHWNSGPIIRELNLFLYDKYTKLFSSVPVSDKVVIVDIDEKSLQRIGQWPWPRYRLGSLIKAADEMDPAAIGLDVLMSEPDRTALSSIRKDFKRDFDLDVSFSGVPPDLIDNDDYLGKILRETATVSAHYFLFDYLTSKDECGLKKIGVRGSIEGINPFEAPGLLCNTAKLHDNKKLSGFINTLDDEDGILRKLPVLIRFSESYYTNLAVATVMQALGVDRVKLEQDNSGTIANIGKHFLPIEPDGTVLLRYPGPAKLYRYVSAIDLLDGNVDRGVLQNKIVFIGSTAAGLYDFHHTVYDPNYPGVETLAVAAGNILESTFIRQPIWGEVLSLFLSLLAAISMALLFIYVGKPGPAIFGVGFLLILLLAGGAAVFNLADLFIPLAAPLVSASLLFALFSMIRYGIEQRSSFVWYQRMAHSQQVTLESMATVVETRDYETGGHIKRTQHFVKIVAEQLAQKGYCANILTPEYIELLCISAPLHDIGKVGVPDHILFKPGPLDYEEFEEMKKHTDYGKNILVNSGKRLGNDNFLELAREIAESHHEKWDGTGYPLGLSGDDIPISGRIMIIADVYDALTSKRCYKPAYPHEKARQILLQGRSIFFDPIVLDAFFDKEADIINISQRISDPVVDEFL